MGFDPAYEQTRIADETAFSRKMRVKRFLHRYVGELYIGKRVKLAYFRDWLDRLDLPAAAQVLEVGSGDGLFVFEAAKRMPRATVVGMELNEIEARVCERIARREGLDNVVFTSGLLGRQGWSDRFDLVYALDVLEHVADDVGVLREMHRALKPGGRVLIHVPHRYFEDVDGVTRTVPDNEAYRINPGHVRTGYTPDELRVTLESAGFAGVETRETQGRWVARGHRLHAQAARFGPLRLLALPLMDHYIRMDRRGTPKHGNTVWALAHKRVSDNQH